MHTMWKGSISFGLVNVPIKMYAATENKDVKFRYLHKECNTPLKYVRMCPSCEREVDWNEIVKGYEYQRDQFVIFEEEELEELSPQKTKTIDILDFVDLSEIDPIYFDKSYYLSPEETGGKAYALLRKAIEDTGKIAVAKVIIRSSQTLCVIRTYDQYLVMESIFYPDEVRSPSVLPDAPQIELSENEVRMATQLIESLAASFDPTKYTNDYRKTLLDAIESKVQGEEIQAPPQAVKNNVVDLMQALQESLDIARSRPASGEEQQGIAGENSPRPRRRRKKEA